MVEGLQFRDLPLFFEERYHELHEQVDQIAERLTGLRGIPTVHPVNVSALSYVEHKPEGQFSVRDMLMDDLAAEKKIAEELRASFKEAIELGDVGTSYLMQELTYKTEERAQHILHFWEEDTLIEEFVVSQKKEADET